MLAQPQAQADQDQAPHVVAHRDTAETRAALTALDALIAAGWSKERIAELCGVGWRSVHRWHKRQSTPVSAGQRKALVDAAASLP